MFELNPSILCQNWTLRCTIKRMVFNFSQVEERRRVEEDEIWRHMCNCHQGTMETYLEDIIVRSVDRTADEQVSVT